MAMRKIILAAMLAGSCATASGQREITEQLEPPKSNLESYMALNPRCDVVKARWLSQQQTGLEHLLVEQTIARFSNSEEMLSDLPSSYHRSPTPTETRRYEPLIRKAVEKRYELFDSNRKGHMPDVVLLGWVHGPIELDTLTPEMEHGMEFILESYQRNDIILPEGYGSGNLAYGAPFRMRWWVDLGEEAIKELEKKPYRPVYSLGADYSDSDYILMDIYYKSQHLAGLRMEMMQAEGNKDKISSSKDAYLRQFEEYFPTIGLEDPSTFDIYECFKNFLSCDSREWREFSFLIPTMKRLVSRKKPGRMVYVPWGAAHITSGKLTAALRDAGIGFVAFVPKNYSAQMSRIPCD